MERIDLAYNHFLTLLSEIDKYKDTIFSEQDARVKIVDRILVEILDWEYEDILTEPQAGKGFIDYKLSIGGASKLIIEAKKDGKDFGIEARHSGKSYKLNGPVLNINPVKDGVDQAIYYCAYKSTELACLTNGRQWVIFRGNRLGDGKDVLNGFGFVFSSLESVKNNFKKFFELLAKPNVHILTYRAYFQEAEGQPLRTKDFNKTISVPDRLAVVKRGEYSSDFDKTMNAFFKQIAGDDDSDLLSKCFVYTKESDLADAKIGRIAEDLINTVKKIDTDESPELTGIIERVKSTNRNEFVLLVGGKGSGKSTFIERFFKYKLSDELKNDCVVISINLGEIESEEAVIKWLNNKIIETIEERVYDGAPKLDELIGMFFHDYRRLSEGNWKILYESNKADFKLEFGKYLENKRENHPEEYIKYLVGDISKRRRKVPCLVFDNTDHFSINFQERVFQYAMSIYEKELCLIILPITDKTSWQLSKQGALQSFDDVEVLHLPTPSPKKVIERRIAYLREKIEPSSVKQNSDYFFGKGIRLSIENLHNFVTCLQEIFLKDNITATWIGNFSNLDIRRCLTLTRDVISSPQLKIEELVGAYVSNSAFSIKPYRLKNSLIKNKYNFYPTGQHNFIYNIYNPNIPYTTSPIIALRVLQLLYDKKGVSVEDNSFISVEQICDYFMAMQIERHITSSVVGDLLKAGLCYSYDPSIIEIDSVKLVELSPSGKQHYNWAARDNEYFTAMIEVTPIRDEPVFLKLNEMFNSLLRGYNEIVANDMKRAFANYLVSEDKWYCSVPKHDAYIGQERLATKISRSYHKK